MSASETAPPAPPFRLETLGTAVLRGLEGRASAGELAQQNRPLALLAALAASGARGRNRDRLLLFFWPDASQERARHSLEQTLYRIRRAVDASAFLGVNPIRLNPDVIASDVAEFDHAIAAGDFRAAIDLYRGPFLDGFHLSEAPEFEEWANGERARLEAAYLGALERLAEVAGAAAEREAAAGWWRRLTEVDPLSTRYALGFMRSLAEAGDHPAALRHAREYERLVEKELGTGAGPEVASLAAEIRAGVMERTPTVRGGPDPAPPVATEHGGPQATDDLETVAVEAGDAAPTRTGPSRRAVFGISALLLAAALLALTRLRPDPVTPSGTEGSEASIAVLPLSNLSADPADAVLADGMSEDLTAMLAKTGDLRVIASTSAFAFRNREADVRSIADSLRVTHVLEGGVQKIGSRLRVQVRLVDARDGSTRWSETYDREIGDLFMVQEEIAGAVARELGARLGRGGAAPLSRNRARNVAAYELYLRGNDPAHLRSDSGPHKALEYFRQAIAIDSTYAAAWAGLARMYGRVTTTTDPGMPIEDLFALSEEAALKAIALDDSLGEAHAALGIIRMRDMDYASAELELRRAVELDPAYGRIREWLVRMYLDTERPQEALAEARRALELDPLSPSAHAELAHALLANDRPDEALVHLGHIAAVRPPLLRTPGLLAQAYAKKGMWPEAIAALGPLRETERSSDLSFYAHILARGGRRDEALRIRDTLLERWEDGNARAVDVAIVEAGLGDFDQAFAWIDRSLEEPTLMNSYVTLTAPIFDDLRRDPRFDRVRERLGIQKR